MSIIHASVIKKIGLVIQVRSSSTRFKNKFLKKINYLSITKFLIDNKYLYYCPHEYSLLTDKYFKYCPYYVQLSLVNMYPHFISKFSLLDQNITARSNPAKYFIYCDIKVKIQLANEYPNYIIAKKKIN